jgi:hypothetical protein
MTSPAAFIVMPYKEPFQSVYSNAIEPTLIRLGLRAVRADQVPGSRSFLEDIETEIRRCELIIVEASEANKNVYFELGLARALQKEVILLTSNPNELPSDTRHLRHLVYDLTAVEALQIELEKWVRHTRAFRLIERANVTKILTRGELFPDIFDATVFLERSAKNATEEILHYIRAGNLINPKYIYTFDKGTRLWIDLCSDPEYAFFLQSVQLLASSPFGVG